jgi:hypothetical protein
MLMGDLRPVPSYILRNTNRGVKFSLEKISSDLKEHPLTMPTEREGGYASNFSSVPEVQNHGRH